MNGGFRRLMKASIRALKMAAVKSLLSFAHQMGYLPFNVERMEYTSTAPSHSGSGRSNLVLVYSAKIPKPPATLE